MIRLLEHRRAKSTLPCWLIQSPLHYLFPFRLAGFDEVADGAISPSRTPRKTRALHPCTSACSTHRQLFQNRPRPARTRHDGQENQRRNGVPRQSVPLIGALRNHLVPQTEQTFAEFSRESCLNNHITHVPFGQVRSCNLSLFRTQSSQYAMPILPGARGLQAGQQAAQ